MLWSGFGSWQSSAGDSNDHHGTEPLIIPFHALGLVGSLCPLLSVPETHPSIHSCVLAYSSRFLSHMGFPCGHYKTSKIRPTGVSGESRAQSIPAAACFLTMICSLRNRHKQETEPCTLSSFWKLTIRSCILPLLGVRV
jgi:hypothetical protein